MDRLVRLNIIGAILHLINSILFGVLSDGMETKVYTMYTNWIIPDPDVPCGDVIPNTIPQQVNDCTIEYVRKDLFNLNIKVLIIIFSALSCFFHTILVVFKNEYKQSVFNFG